LLALGSELDAIEQEWLTQSAIDRTMSAAIEAKVRLATGMAFEDAPEMTEDWGDDEDGYWAVRDRIVKEECRDDPKACPWDSIHARMWPLVDDILGRKAHTIAGLTMQVRALRMARCSSEELEEDNVLKPFVASVSAFVGVSAVAVQS
jgi:hypothetical protein